MSEWKLKFLHGKKRLASILAAVAMAICCASAVAQQSLTTPSTGAGIGTSGPSANAADRSKSSDTFKLNAVPEDFSKLKLAPGDLINIAVFGGDDFSGPHRLDIDGTITIPFVGRVQISGRSVAEAQELIAGKLVQSELFTKPQVQVTIVEYTAPMVTILGEVASPGQYPLLAERKFVDVIALAGGLTPTAGNAIEIHRPEGIGEHVIKFKYARGTSSSEVENITVKAGDVVQVGRAGIVYVLGAVNRPGGYLMQEDGKLDAIQAIALAYGAATQAAVGDIRIIRRAPNGEILQIPVPYRKSMKAQAAPIMLRAEDVVYVPPSKLKTALLDSQSIISGLASTAIVNGIR
ncbi:MAG: polysaccharide biosynthesis/export family protein [Candidatus Korobacteraceae bacterium]|jgi:polysaccharide export outer membrane protein